MLRRSNPDSGSHWVKAREGGRRFPSQETGLEKYWNASSGVRSGVPPFFGGSSSRSRLKFSRLGEWPMFKSSFFRAVFSFLILFNSAAGIFSTLRAAESAAENSEAESGSAPLSARSPATLPEVVITASRLETPANEIPSSVSVVTARDLEQKQSMTALEALQGVPGLDLVKNGGAGGNSSAFIRGANPEHTLVLMDGIPLNDPLSTNRVFFDWDQLFVDDIKQIEVVRGPESPLYGSNAMGGVINVISQKGEGRPRGSLSFEGGAYHSFRESATAGFGGEEGGLFLAVSRFDSAGFSSSDQNLGNLLPNGDQNTTGSLRAEIAPLPDLKGNFLFHYTQSHTSLDDGGGPGTDNPNYFGDGKMFLAGGQTSLKLLDGDWEQILGISFTDHLRTYTNDPSVYQPYDYERGVYDGQSGQISWQNNLRVAKGETLVLGLQGQQEWGNSTEDFGYGPATLTATARTGSVFAESQASLGDRFFQTFGARLDFHSQFGSHSTYRAGAAYYVPDIDTKLKATYGTGFRAPSLYQLYSPYGNLLLSPETSVGFDAGFEQPVGNNLLLFGATYFHNDFEGLIDYDFSTSQYVNVGRAQTSGLETFADLRGIPGLDIRGSYTLTEARNTSTGDPLLRRPRNKAGMDVFYRWDDAELGASVQYTGDRRDVTFPPPAYALTPVTMPEYFILNLMGSYRLGEHVKLFARIHNLFNETYEEVYGYGTAGLSVYAGTKVSF
jgi:vitamin B12 transporter